MSEWQPIEPPALPDRLHDQDEDRGPQSSWDALALTIIQDCTLIHHSNRCRVRWLRYCLFRWHCGRRMRLATIEYQDKNVTFGWQRYWRKFIACGTCGKIMDTF